MKAHLLALARSKDDELEQILTVSVAAEERAQQELSDLREKVAHLQLENSDAKLSVMQNYDVQKMEEEIVILRAELDTVKHEKSGLAARLEHALASPSPSPFKS